MTSLYDLDSVDIGRFLGSSFSTFAITDSTFKRHVKRFATTTTSEFGYEFLLNMLTPKHADDIRISEYKIELSYEAWTRILASSKKKIYNCLQKLSVYWEQLRRMCKKIPHGAGPVKFLQHILAQCNRDNMNIYYYLNSVYTQMNLIRDLECRVYCDVIY